MNRYSRIVVLILGCCPYAVSLSQALGPDDDEGSTPDTEIAELESRFSSTDPGVFRILRTSFELPSVPLRLLKREAYEGRLAEWGERWNSTDVIGGDQATAQHVLSWISGSTTLIVFRTGGFGGSTTNLLLFDSASPVYCMYRSYSKDIPAMLSIEGIQWLMRPGRTFGVPRPTCRARYVSSMRRTE